MKKRQSLGVSLVSRKTNSFESSLQKISRLYRVSAKNNSKIQEKDFKKTIVINPTVAKLTFVFLMVAVFFALSLNTSPSHNSITSFSVLDEVSPGTNLVIFFGLLGLIFFLTYETRKLK